MIEFTVRLNLPVRSVAVTETTADPPSSFRREKMLQTAGQARTLSASVQSAISSNDSSSHDLGDSKEFDDDEIDQLRESLRTQEALFTNAARTLQETTRTIEQQLHNLVIELNGVAVELATSVAAKLVFDQVSDNRFPIENLVHEVLDRLDTRVKAVVRLHPQDLALLHQIPTIGESSSDQSVQYLADPTMARGDCKAKAGDITVTYELRRQIESIRQQLLSTVSGHAESGS